MSFSINYCPSIFKELVSKFPNLLEIVVHSCPSNLLRKFNVDSSSIVSYTNRMIDSNLHCGNISSNYFTPNISFYLESLKHNSCLNQKISIDVNGFIKNCPSMSKSFGNVFEDNIEDIVNSNEFQLLWNIKKDDIEVCKDCEFRYICTDCRAYVEDPKDIYSKPLKCGYNPYTAEWSEWSTNPLKQKTIDFYEMREMVTEVNDPI